MHGLPPYILFIALLPTFCFNFLYKVRSSNERVRTTSPLPAYPTRISFLFDFLSAITPAGKEKIKLGSTLIKKNSDIDKADFVISYTIQPKAMESSESPNLDMRFAS